jgi:[ribosomal protein S5]-alanine N-acetyltransferase
MTTSIRLVNQNDSEKFVSAAIASRTLHRPWVSPPTTTTEFTAYLARFTPPSSYGFIVTRGDGTELAGAINLTNIIYGNFCSAYLGYFAFAGCERQGHMKRGIKQVMRHAFDILSLHRLEANIQPENVASIALARSCGFTREGFSPAYLKIGGRWCDHERWAIVRK